MHRTSRIQVICRQNNGGFFGTVQRSSEYYRDFFDESRRTIVYCAGGIRSVLATRTLTEMGYSNVAHLESGFRGWKQSGEPIDDVASRSKWIRRPAGE